MKPLENMLKVDEYTFEVGLTLKGRIDIQGVVYYYIPGIVARASATETPLRFIPLMTPMIYCI